MAKVEAKQAVIDEISNVINGADSVVLVNYSGITVAQDTELRRAFREEGISYKVYKNTMMNFAFKGTPCEELCKHLEGTNAIAVSKDDATAPVRIISKFAKTAPALELIAGVVEGGYYDSESVKKLADIPARDVLLSRLFGSMTSPIANFARVLNQIAEKNGGAAEAAPAAEETPAAEAAPAE